MVQTDTTETNSLLSTSGTSPDQPALPDLRADQDRVRDRTLRNREKATRWLQLESHSLLGPHGKRNLGMGICWAESNSVPQLLTEEGSLLSLHLPRVLSPAFGNIMNPMCVKLKTKVISFAITALTLPVPCPLPNPFCPDPYFRPRLLLSSWKL